MCMRAYAMACVWRWEENLQEWFLYVNHGSQSQIIKLGTCSVILVTLRLFKLKAEYKHIFKNYMHFYSYFFKK